MNPKRHKRTHVNNVYFDGSLSGVIWKAELLLWWVQLPRLEMCEGVGAMKAQRAPPTPL